MLTPHHLQQTLAAHHPIRHLFIAYSGGVDSHVLLQLSAQLALWRGKITAVYVHHGLQAVADHWAQHTAEIAKLLGVQYQVLYVQAQAAKGESPEEAARNARYHALAQLLQPDDAMLFAQHQDDQLETVLLQLFRGAGLQGLAGMPESAPLGLGKMLRPFLAISRQAIETYAQQQQLHWVEDPSNSSTAFDRNYLRHSILPLLQQRWPSIAKTVSRSAKHCAQAQQILLTATQTELSTLCAQQPNKLDLNTFTHYTPFQQQAILRTWIASLGLKMPSEALLQSLITQVIFAAPTRDPQLIYQQQQFRRYRQQLFCLPMLEPLSTQDWPKMQSQIMLNAHAHLRVQQSTQGIDAQRWQQAEIQVRARQGGEKIALVGRSGQHCVKKLLQEAGIPPWLREQVPLIYLDGKLAAVADRWVSREFWVHDSDALVIVWQIAENLS